MVIDVIFPTIPLSYSERRRTMIKLNVEEYCHTCPEFYPEKVGGEVYYAEGEVIYINDTFVRCDNYDKCQRIKKHLEKNLDRAD